MTPITIDVHGATAELIQAEAERHGVEPIDIIATAIGQRQWVDEERWRRELTVTRMTREAVQPTTEPWPLEIVEIVG